MAKVAEHEVKAVVDDILADKPAAVEGLRARAATEPPASRDELLREVEEKNLPLLDTTGSGTTPELVGSKAGAS